MGQVPKFLVTETQLSFPLFKFFPQFGEGIFLFKHIAYDRVVLLQRHGAMSLHDSMKLMVILTGYTTSAGVQDFYPARVLLP